MGGNSCHKARAYVSMASTVGYFATRNETGLLLCFLSMSSICARIASRLRVHAWGSPSPRPHASSTLIAVAGLGVVGVAASPPACPASISETLAGKSLHSSRSMHSRRSPNELDHILGYNSCGRASRSGWKGEAERRSVDDRRLAESPTEGHNALRYQTKTHTCDRLLR